MADSNGGIPPDSDETPEADVPVLGEVVPDKFSSDEVFQRIVADADHEITSGTRELFFSALAGGFAITITLLVYASMYPRTDSSIVAALLYPIGFIYIIIGGYQLYTENTLPPVALTLERLASVPALFRHWGIVAAGNFAGGALGAVVLAYGGVLSPEAAAVAADLAVEGVYETTRWELFFKGAFAGLVVAGVVWMNFASRDTISRLAIVYLAFLTIPLGNLFHVVVSFTEAVYLMLVGDLGLLLAMTDFVVPVLVGNTLGGVVLVTVVNYYQTTEDRLATARFENVRRLSVREWLLGSLAGRSYVPLVDTVEEFVRDPDSYRVLVPITNPRTESALVELACAVASSRPDGTVHVAHVVQMPGDGRGDDRRQRRRITDASERQLEEPRRIGERYDVRFETSTIVTHRSFEDVFDRANRTRPDLVMMGWADDGVWASARAERPVAELTNRLPCDFIVVKDRGLDCSRVLVPTAGGPSSDLSGEIACALRDALDAEVSLLHVVDGPEQRADGERFLRSWGEAHGLGDAAALVDETGDVEGAVKRAAADHSVVLLGATEQGLLARLVADSLHMNVVDEVDCSVLLSERPTDRPLRERLFGSGRREKGRPSTASQRGERNRADGG